MKTVSLTLFKGPEEDLYLSMQCSFHSTYCCPGFCDMMGGCHLPVPSSASGEVELPQNWSHKWPLLARLSGHLLPYLSILPVLFELEMENFRLMSKLQVAEGWWMSISHSHHCRAVSSRASSQLPLSASLPDSPSTLLSPLWNLEETKDMVTATKEMKEMIKPGTPKKRRP